MSHIINYTSYPETVDKGEITCDIIMDVEERSPSGLYRPIRWLNDVTLESYNEAEDYIKDHDDGHYDNLAVKYQSKDSEGKPTIYWLIKYEFHV